MGNLTQNEKALLKTIRKNNLENIELFIDELVESTMSSYNTDMGVWKRIEQEVEEEGCHNDEEEEVNNRLRVLGWNI